MIEITDKYIIIKILFIKITLKKKPTKSDLYDFENRFNDKIEKIRYNNYLLNMSKNINYKTYLNILHFNFDDSNPYVTSAAIFKFDIANILSDYNKVLYIDCDTIILKDLTELFEINLNDYYVAVVKDFSLLLI